MRRDHRGSTIDVVGAGIKGCRLYVDKVYMGIFQDRSVAMAAGCVMIDRKISTATKGEVKYGISGE